jgi:circadian clock protein KaiC
VYPRLEIALARPLTENEAEPALVATGIADLDQLVGGGLSRGSVTLLMGPSGSGKSSFALSFPAALTVEAKGLLFGFYESPARLQMKAKALGVDFDTLVESGALKLLWQPLTENLPDKLAYRLLDSVSELKVQRLVIDWLNGFERAAIYKPRLAAFFAALTNELRALGVTTVAISGLRDLFGPKVTAPEVDQSIFQII